MADYLTKHEPVDDYPYICYAPDADMSTDDVSSGGGGGGGGGGGWPLLVNIESEIGEDEL